MTDLTYILLARVIFSKSAISFFLFIPFLFIPCDRRLDTYFVYKRSRLPISYHMRRTVIIQPECKLCSVCMHKVNRIMRFREMILWIFQNGLRLAFQQTRNSAVPSVLAENPTLEPNMTGIGWHVAELGLWPFKIFCKMCECKAGFKRPLISIQLFTRQCSWLR